MISKTHSLRVLRNSIGLLILLAAFVVTAGCSTANKTGGAGDVIVNHVNASGNSVPGWVTPTGGLHANSATMNYIANGGSSSCTECHGSDLAGGISRVSCFGNPAGCHHGPIGEWISTSPPQNHGISAKKAPGSSGFASCQICHGSNFSGGGANVSCFTCHGVSAPHAPKPWLGSPYTHTDTDTANASVCYQCHAYTGTANPNNPHVPPTPAPAGTAPGCFNGTMCHNQPPAPHITGSTWLNAGTGFHGTDAKSDLTGCQGCHGTPGTIFFDGGSAPTACSTCHTASKAHPTDWQGLRTINGVTITHRTSGNRDVACAICHNTTGPGTGPNPSAPSCFSASFTNAGGQARACHSGGPGSAPHALGATWVIPATGGSAFHGTTAKADLLFCQTCHGTPPRGFGGGTGATTACTTCHATAEAHPTDWQGVRAISTASITHRTSGNLTAACGICHSVTAPGTGPNPAAPSCFSASYTNGAPGAVSRACHASGPSAPNHPVPFFDNTTHTQANTTTFSANCGTCHAVTGTSPVSSAPLCTTCHTAGSPLTALTCTSCHASAPDSGAPAGAAYPNLAGAHAAHIALDGAGTPVASCDTCHSGVGTGTLAHYNNARPPRVEPGSVAFSAGFLYAGITGTAVTFDNALAALTCSNVSCHGAQGTPNWRTGTTACTSCHTSATVAPAIYNDYTQTFITHDQHINRTACTTCHTALPASTHFGTLSDKAIASRAAAATINPNFAYPSPLPAGPSMGSCNTSSVGGCH